MTAIVKIAVGIAIRVSATAALGGCLLTATMFVAVLIHLFVIGDSPVPAFVLLFIITTIA
ncbi:hypothetical protein VSX61_01975 [Brenneria populi subsp. brevivirga]|uniref:hypothetical protein n=1 Tax=Brenneria populi TaxID=1505588 RepID=UPI002E18F562|nr:hypothetical protein [Brenneria populi subsp. brevivirga]